MTNFERSDITGLVLAGGQGRRMGGADKGLLMIEGKPQALRLAEQLASQTTQVMISANRNIAAYQKFGFPVIQDSLSDYPGPLAGILAGLTHCTTELLLVTPCDTPELHPALAQNLLRTLNQSVALLSYVQTVSDTDVTRDHPGFALIHRSLKTAAEAYLTAGHRKVFQWFREQHAHPCQFPEQRSFDNLNTPEALQEAFRL